MNTPSNLTNKFFQKKLFNTEVAGLKELNALIEQQLIELSPLFEDIQADVDKIDITLPTIKITELWGKVNNKDRSLIEQLTRNVGGDSIEEKIQNINRICEFDETADLATIFSTLIFMDCLRSIVVEYTESVSGFLFEGFLAGIIGKGSVQITDAEDAEGQVGKPITDVALTIGDGGEAIQYSLKLLSPKTTIEGSFKNLVNHFKSYDHVVYLTVRKESNDIMRFLEFTITKENFLDWIGFAWRSEKAAEIIDDLEMSGSDLEELWTDAETGERWLKHDDPDEGEVTLKVTKIIDVQTGRTVAKNHKIAPDRRYTVFYSLGDEEDAFKKLSASGKHLYGNQEEFEVLLGLANSGSHDEFIKALEASPGYQKSLQFHIASDYASRNSVEIGAIDLSQEKIYAVANNYAGLLQSNLIPIYNELAQLTDNINKYFLGTAEGDIATRRQYALKASQNAVELKNNVDSATD
tara:strand:+ start:11661 stop:13058 length:1398 start_codon:yes stop_codon:yes gene_type:complete